MKTKEVVNVSVNTKSMFSNAGETVSEMREHISRVADTNEPDYATLIELYKLKGAALSTQLACIAREDKLAINKMLLEDHKRAGGESIIIRNIEVKPFDQIALESKKEEARPMTQAEYEASKDLPDNEVNYSDRH